MNPTQKRLSGELTVAQRKAHPLGGACYRKSLMCKIGEVPFLMCNICREGRLKYSVT